MFYFRPDVILNNSFAARVRRVFAKVKATRQSEETTEDPPTIPFKWPMLSVSKTRRSSGSGSSGADKPGRQQQIQRHDDTLDRGNESGKRLLPTIAESCSFDSLRESPMMEIKFQIDPVVSTERTDAVVINIEGEDGENSST